MTIFREPLANSKGEVMLSMQATGVVPAGAVSFRGMWVTMNGLVCATNDTGQARKYVGGFAFEDPSGLLLVTETAPASVPMDGINANAAGAVVTKGGAASLIHQGVGMTVSEPGGPLVVNKDEPALTFLAPLEYGINSAVIEGVGTRDSQATYWAQDGNLRIAGVNEIRQEFQNGQPLGTLIEPASTNKCTNYNANPDQALTNLSLVGDPAAVLSRVEDAEGLAKAGLGVVCSNQLVLKLDNSAASGSTALRIGGTVGNTNMHTVSGWAKNEVGNPSDCVLKVTGTGSPSVTVTSTEWAYYSDSGTPAGATNQVEFVAPTGSIGYLILNQLEEKGVPTSVIVVEGAASARAEDSLQWSLTDSLGRNILNQTAGMFGFVFRPGAPYTSKTTTTVHISLGPTSANSMVTHGPGNNVARLEDGTNTLSKFRNYAANADILISGFWSAATMQLNTKVGGSWDTWGSGPYDGAFRIDTVMSLCLAPEFPAHYRGMYFWNENKGTTWLENFFSGVAN